MKQLKSMPSYVAIAPLTKQERIYSTVSRVTDAKREKGSLEMFKIRKIIECRRRERGAVGGKKNSTHS